jgi:hypothetical protein
MATASELLRQGRKDELWNKYCGFFDLTIEEFMGIQERLLMEQLQLLGACELGEAIIGPDMPQSLEDFRRVAPITTYRDYVDYLESKNEEVLPVKPYCWMRTSGRSGEYTGKLVPTSHQFYSLTGKYLLATVMLASAREKGDINLEEGGTFLYAVAPPPYISGTSMRAISEEFPFRFIPPIPEAEEMSFEERLTQAFLRSIETGIGHFVGIASVLLRMGEAFSQGSGQMSATKELLRPMAIYRVGKALALSKLQRRPMLPRDLWNPRGIVASGMDVQIYKKRIESMWGCTPLEAYACTEFGTIAIQAWGAKSDGLTFAPDSALWEFMPEDEYLAWRQDPDYKPTTLLMNEVQPGRYVLLGTSFAGGAFVRYLIGDLVSILSVRDDGLGIDLPQMVMESRADDVIDLGSLVLLTERAIWQGIGHLDLSLVDWTARKEYTPEEKDPIVHMCVEGEGLDSEQLGTDLHNALVDCIEDYATYYRIMKMNPWRITSLSPGTFGRYLELKQAEGADIGHLKPPRMQPSDEILATLLQLSAEPAGES